jgi:hypothetical protein
MDLQVLTPVMLMMCIKSISLGCKLHKYYLKLVYYIVLKIQKWEIVLSNQTNSSKAENTRLIQQVLYNPTSVLVKMTLNQTKFECIKLPLISSKLQYKNVKAKKIS